MPCKTMDVREQRAQFVVAAMRREWVQLLRLEDQVQVYCCRTLARELDRRLSPQLKLERMCRDKLESMFRD